MTKFLFTIILFIVINQSIEAQIEIKYNHCNCIEKIDRIDEITKEKDGNYILTCNNSKFVEEGEYKNGVKDGTWTIKNPEGTLISRINYSQGKLNGSYELYYYKGEPKLKAHFSDNIPDKEWTYYNQRGKIIKQGIYKNGKALGVWKVYDKKGSKVIAEYDFSTNKMIKSNDNPKIKNSYLPRDAESGAYVIIYYPKRSVLKKNIPLGGNIYTNKLFIDLFNVPIVLMDGIISQEYVVKGKIKDGILTIDSVDYLENNSTDNDTLSFPYIAITESKKNRKKLDNTNVFIPKLKERIFETMMVMGPWISDRETEISIDVPFVLNAIQGL